jgi:hypothetical protein
VTYLYCNTHMYVPCLYCICVCTWPFYIAACVHLLRARIFTFLKLRPFVASCHINLQPVTNLYLSTVPINLYYQPCTSITHTTCTITSASTMHITIPHNHHQDQDVLLLIYQDIYATSSIYHVSNNTTSKCL